MWPGKRFNLQPPKFILASLIVCFVSTVLKANPVLNNVASGNVSIQQTQNTTTIQQSSTNAIINWQQFNIGQNQAVHYLQPNGGITLNRVSPAYGASQIYGQLTATGEIILINPAGIYFSPTAYVNVGSIIASTANISNRDFLQGNFHFQAVPGYNGAVINAGTIRAVSHGLVALIGSAVENDGTIQANLGNVVLGAGSAFTFHFAGNDLLNFNINKAVSETSVDENGNPIKTGVSNAGRIIANGGTVRISANAAEHVLDEAINMSGIVEANSVSAHNGEIIFSGGGNGAVVVTGKVLAQGKRHSQHGGSVKITGQQIDVDGLINTSGMAGGGDISIGGSPTAVSGNATSLIFGPNAIANASAISTGNAGKVTLYSNQNTQFLGNVLARGGALSGNGGQVEISGNTLAFTGNVDTSAAEGLIGSLLLDPEFLIIQTSGGSTYSSGTNNLFSNNPSGTSIITPASLSAIAANITLQANTDVIFNNAVSLTTAGDSLTVQAGRSVLVNSSISTNNGAISLTANDNTSNATYRLTTSASNPTGDNETVNGNITLANGVTLNSGTATTSLTIGSSTTAPYSPGSITQGTTGGITAGNVTFVVPTASSGSIGVNGTPLLTTSMGILMLTTGTGGAFIANTGSITLATPTLASNAPLFVTSSGTLTLPAASISTGTGNLTLESLGGALTTAGNISTTSGNILLVASTALSLGSSLTVSSSGSGDITLNANTGATGSNAFTMNSGSSISTASTDATAVVINVNGAAGGTGTATLGNITTGVGGTLTVATNTGSNTTGGSITQLATTALNTGSTGVLNLSTGTAAAGIGTSGANILSLTGKVNATTGTTGFYIANSQALALGTINTTGALTVTAGGSLTQSGVVTATGTSTFGVTTAASNIILNNASNRLGVIAFGGTAADINNLSLTSMSATASLGSLATLTNLANLTLNFSGAAISLNAITTNAGNVSVTSGSSITTTGNITTNGGSVALTAGTGLTLANAISAGAGAVTLSANNAGSGANNFTMSGTGAITTTNSSTGAVVINVNNTAGGTGTATLQNITTGAGGTIAVATNYGGNTTGGSISQVAATLLNSGVGGNLTLATGAAAAGIGASAAPLLAQTASLTATTGSAGIYVNNTQATALGAISTTGSFALTTGGSITQSAALTVTGTSTFTSTAALSDVLLSNTANSFGAIAFTGTTANFRDLNLYNTSASASLPTTLIPLTGLRNVTYDFTNAGAVLPEETLYNSGNLNVIVNGNVTQAGQQNVPGTTNITAGANSINLSLANNIFTGAVTLSNSGANNVALTDNSDLVFGNVSVGSGTLTLLSTKTVTQLAATSIIQASGAGIATFSSLGGLTLTNSTNGLAGFSDTNLLGGNIQLTNTTANLQVAGLSAAGGGNIVINNTGGLTVSSGITNTPNGTITLNTSGTENINSAITSSGSGAVSLTGGTGINLGANVTTSGGNITFNGPVTLTASPTLNSSIGNITFTSTLDGSFLPTFTSSGILTFGNVIGGITPLTGLIITANSPGSTIISNNVTTNGSQTYGNPVTLNGSATLLANGSNAITITGGFSWSSAYTLALNAQSIAMNGPIYGPNGSLNLTAAVPPTASITTGVNGAINVNNFNLLQGYWSQTGTLPAFAVANNFSINSGSIPTSIAEFVRVGGGAGTSGSPYQITDVYGLQGIESNTSLLADSYVLTASFTASTGNWNSGIGFIPIGSAAHPFTGTSFNGQGNTISGVSINSALATDVGLFGTISSGTTLSNVGLAGVSVTSSSASASNIGALVGQNNGGTLSGDYSTGSVTSSGSGATNIGGLVGDNLGGITLSYSGASVTTAGSSSDIGGLVGKNESSGAYLNTSYSAGNITAGSSSSNIGGLVGYENSTHTNAIQNTYSISGISVTSGTNVGGLVGDEISGPIATSYSSGLMPVSGTNIGGFVGNTSIATNTNNFFDSTSSGTGTAVGLGSSAGVTAGCFAGVCANGGIANLSSTATFSGATWSIAGSPNAGTTAPATIWYIIPGDTRPMLAMEWSTSVTNPHQLELTNMALGASYSLGNINLSVASPTGNAADVWGGSANTVGFYSIGNTANNFTGSLNGGTNGATISNLYINSAAITGIGLIGATSAAATITNVSVTGANITDSGSNVGILVGQNNGTITNAAVSGSVTANGTSVSNIGGLVGQNTGTITATTNLFSDSLATVNTSGTGVSNVGDLVGQNTGSILNSYSTGAVTIAGNSASNIGGLIGDNQGGFSGGYSTSNVTLSGLLPSNVGGLVGTNEGVGGYINIGYSSGTIAATNATSTATNVGGLVGKDNSTYTTTAPIQNVYSTSGMNLSGNGTNVGGLVGDQIAGAIVDTYSIGAASISGVSTNVGGFIGAMGINITNVNNYYDTTTSGNSTSVGSVGTGSTIGVTQGCFSGTCPHGGTANLSSASTYIGAGWDLATVPVWGIFDGVTYPYLTALTLGVQVTDVNSGGVTPTTATNNAILTPAQVFHTGNNYDFLFYKSTLTTNPILFYNTSGTVGNALVAPPTGSYTAPLTITISNNTIQVGGSNTGTISTNNFGGLTAGGSNILFSSGNSFVLGNATNPNVTLQTSASTTLNINSTISSYGSNDVITVNGAATLNNNGGTISTSGNQTYNGNITQSSAATLTDTNTSAAVTINGNLSSNSTLIFNTIDANSAINGIYSGASSLTMQGTGTLTLAGNNTYTNGTTLANGILELNSAGVASTPLGSGTLTFSGGDLVAGSALTAPIPNNYTQSGIAAISTIGGLSPTASNLTLSGTGTLPTGYILNITNAATTTLSGNISGSGAINEVGGTLVLSGANNSSYSGITTLSGNGTLDLGTATNVTGTGTLVLNSGTVQSLVASPTTLVLNDPIVVNSNVTLGGTNNLINLGGQITLYGGNLTITNTGTTTLSGTLAAGAGSLTVNSTGGTVIVSGASNSAYLGATTLTSGTLDINAATNALGTGTGNSLILNGGLLQSTYSSGTASLVNKFLVSGSATIGGTNNLTLNGNGILNNVLNVTNTAGTVTLNGTLIGVTGSIAESGTGGTLVIPGSNTFGTAGTTGVTVTGGTLLAENNKALGIGNVAVNAAIGAELALSGNGSGSLTVANPLSLNGTGVSSAGALVDVDTSSEGNTYSGPVTLTGNASVGVTGSNETFTLSGGITNGGFVSTFNPTTTDTVVESGVVTGTGGIQMSGNGTLQLSGTNTSSGNNTAAAGTILVSNAQGLGLSNKTTINSGALVKVSGVSLVGTEAFTLNGGTLAGTKNVSQAGEAGAITLAANTADTISTLVAGDTFTIGGSINGTTGTDQGDLTLAGAGSIISTSSIGATTAINSLTDSSALTVNSGGGSITSVGNQTYNGAVTAATAVTATSNTGNITITNTFGLASNNLGLTANSGSVSESGSGVVTTTGTVTTHSTTGTTLNAATNSIKTFSASDTSSTGIALTNATALTLNAITETGTGAVTIANTGSISDAGIIQNSGGNSISLTSSGAISQSSHISGSLLTTNSKGGTVLGGANTVTSFNATNGTSGNITLVNTAAPLAITGITQSGGGSTSVTNTGAMNVTGAVTGGGGAITLTATGITVAASTSVSAGAANITVNAGAGNAITLNSGTNISTTGKITFTADQMAFNTSATPSAIGGTGATVVLQEATTGASIGIAGATGTLQLTAAALADVNATNVYIGNSTAGAIGINAWTTSSNFAKNGVLTLDSASTISQGGTIDILTNSNSGLVLRDASSVNLATNAGAGNNINNIAATNIGGTLKLTANHAVAVSSLTDATGTVNGISATGGVTINALTNGITLNSTVTANTAGYDIVLAGGAFTNNVGSAALVTGGGSNYFQVWSGTPTTDNRGSLAYNFLQYNASYGTTTPGQATGNGFLYTIAPVITPTLIGNVTKVYDGNTNATLTSANYSPSGTLNGDTVTFNNPTSGTYDTAQAGTGKNIAVTGISITGESNGAANIYGYQLSSSSANGNIGTITDEVLNIINIVANNKVYDTTTSATLSNTGSLSGVIGSDNVTLNASTLSAAFQTKNAANGITVNVTGYTLGGTNANDYTLAPASTTANITPAPITVSGATANNKVYDSTTAATLNTSSATIAGVYAVDAANVVLNGGTGTFSSQNVANNIPVTVTGITLTGSAISNYMVTPLPTGLTANITPATLTYNANTATAIYGESYPSFSGSVTGFKGSDSLSSATTGTTAFTTPIAADSNVGSYAINGSGLTANNGNYVFVQAAGNSTALTITPATLTETANTATRIYGASNPSLSGNISGFVNGDSLSSATTGSLTFSTTASLTTNVGNYSINGSGLTANNGNYIFVQAAGNSTALSITPRALNIAGTRTYDSTVNFTPSQLTLSNIVNGDTVTVTGSATNSSQNVGSYTSFVTNSLVSSNSNYMVTGGTVSLSITPATLTYNGTAASMIYGNTVATPMGTVTGFMGSDNLSSATTGTASFSTVATNTSNVGSYAITGSGLSANNGNYVFVQAAGNNTALTINQRPVNITGTHVYDSTVNFTPSELTFSNVVNGDTVTLGGSATTASANVNSYTSFASNSLTTSNSNYTAVGGTISVSVTPATLTYNSTAASMTYGNSVPSLTGSVTGFVGGQSIATATTGTLGFTTSASNTSNVGMYAINGSGLTANNGNYVFVQAAGNSTALTINQRAINISGTHVYDATVNFTPAQLTLSNIVNGDTVTVSGGSTVSSANVGSYTSFASNSLTASNSNYTTVGGTISASITPATLTYNSTAANMTYGNSVPSLTGSVTGFVGGESLSSATTGTLNFTTPASNTSNVGSYAINGTGLAANNGNYVFVQAAGNSSALTINQRSLNISGTHVYDATVNFTPTQLTASNIVNGDTVTLGGSATVSSANVGSYTSFVSNSLTSSNSNYSVTGGTVATSITPATLTYNGTSTSMTYGNTVPTVSGNVTGFVGGQTISSATTGSLAFTTLATNTSNVGSYAINGSGLTANNGNYVFTQAAGNATALTINQRAINISGTHVYDATVNFTPSELTTSNIVNGDTVTLGGSATSSSANVGSYTSFASNSLTSSNSNYTTVGGTVGVSVTPATLTYNSTTASMTYGNSVPSLTGSVTGFVGGQSIATATTGSLGFSTTASNTSNVGNYAITGAGLTANNGNYVFVQAAGNSTALTINQRALNISGTHVYDATTNFSPAQLTLSNIVNGDTVTVSGGSTVSSANVGSYTSFASNSLIASNSNYTTVGGTIATSITPATLTYNSTAANMTYGNSVPSLTGSVTGFVGGQTIGSATTGTLGFNTTASNTSNVGSYAINGSGLTANNGNYVFVQAAGNTSALTINQRSLNISGTHVYDATVNFTPAELTASNIVNGDTVTLGGSATVSSANVGSYTSFASNSLTASNSNYSVTGGTISTSITPATLTYHGTATSMTYGNSVPSLTGNVTGFVGGESLSSATTGSLGFTTSASNTSNVGSYAINGSGLTANNGNYVFTQAAGNATALTINQRAINISGTHVYDATVNFTPSELTTSNIVNGDTVTLGGSATSSSANVGSYSSFASNSLTSSNSNYTTLGGTIAVSVTPATLTYNSTTASMTYGNSVPSLTGSVTGFVGGESLSSATTGSLGFTTSASNTSNVGSYAINGSGLTANNGNYVFVQAAGNTLALTINQRPINISGTHVYDTTVNFTPSELSTGNIVNGDTVTLGGSATVSSANVGSYTNFATNSLTASNSNYTVVGGTVSTSITPATLTYNSTTASMTYGDSVPSLTGSVTGFVGSDTLNSATTGTLGFNTLATNTSNVGSYAITGLGLTADNGNYLFVQATGNNAALTINQRPLNISGTHVYDATVNFTPSELSTSNIVNGDTVTLGGSATVNSANVGSYTSFANNNLTASNSNYTVVGGTISTSITPATLTYNGTITNMTYGDTVPALAGNVTGFVGGETLSTATTGSLAFTTLATNTSDVGSYAINGSGLTANNGNYVFTQATGNTTALTINQRPLNITGTHVYDATVNFTPSELTSSNIVNGDTVTVGGSATVASQNVGNYSSFATNNLTLSDSNYTLTGGTLLASITPATLTYHSNTGSMVYGTPVPVLSGGITGFVGGETISSATTGSMAFTTPATSTSNVGNYAINGSGLTADNGNYVFTQANSNGTALAITPATLTVNLVGTVSKVFNGTSTAALTPNNYSLSGIVNNDSVVLNDPTLGLYDSPAVGTDKLVTVNGLSISGSAAGNYVLAVDATSADVGTILPSISPSSSPGSTSGAFSLVLGPVTSIADQISQFTDPSINAPNSDIPANQNGATGCQQIKANPYVQLCGMASIKVTLHDVEDGVATNRAINYSKDFEIYQYSKTVDLPVH